MAAGATYEPIATQTLASAAASITFSSIAATYTDLRLVLTALSATSAGTYPYVYFNGISGTTNYSQTNISANGATAISSAETSVGSTYLVGSGTFVFCTDVIPGTATLDIFSYAGSTNKTTLCSTSIDTNGAGNVARSVILWRSTAAITSINLGKLGQNYGIGTTATLYGIKAA